MVQFRKTFLWVGVLALACGKGDDGKNGSSCTVTENTNGTATISCDDGTTALVSDGADGADGDDGATGTTGADGTTGTDGTDGDSCTVTENADDSATITCEDGTEATVPSGIDGDSCSVADNGDGTATISCEDGTSVDILTCDLGSYRCENDDLEACTEDGWTLVETCDPGECQEDLGVCQPAEGALRLVDGTNDDEGRVEIFLDGAWGTICDDGFDDVDATVACRQLGYESGTVADFGAGTVPSALEWVDCDGTEDTILDCASDPSTCGNSEDVGVICTGTTQVGAGGAGGAGGVGPGGVGPGGVGGVGIAGGAGGSAGA